MSKLDMMHFVFYVFRLILLGILVARIGAKMCLFWSRDPHSTTLPWHPIALFIYNIYIPPTHISAVSGGWSRGVPRPKTSTVAPILATTEDS